MNKRNLMVVILLLAFTTLASAQQDVPAREQQSRNNPQREMDAPRRAVPMEQREAELDAHRAMRDREWQEQRERFDQHLAREHRDRPVFAIFLAVSLIVHILLTVWVYQDMRQRNTGSGLWIPIVLLSGFFGALLYGVARLGDVKNK